MLLFIVKLIRSNLKRQALLHNSNSDHTRRRKVAGALLKSECSDEDMCNCLGHEMWDHMRSELIISVGIKLHNGASKSIT